MRLFYIFVIFILCKPAYASIGEAEKSIQAGDFQRAITLLTPLAEAGDARAQANLGMMHVQGIGTVIDMVKGIYWTKRSAEAGNVKAQANLGLFYYHGNGVDRNFGQAAAWLEKAASQGNAGAQGTLGVLYIEGEGVNKDYAKARSLLDAAIRGGNSGAANNLARMIEFGLGADANLKSALGLYEIAAQADDAAAQNRVGLAYLNGEFREKNVRLAREWFLKSSRQGQKHGLFHYAMLLLESGPPDKVAALTLLSISAKQGYEPSALELARHSQTLTPIDKSRLELNVAAWRPSGTGVLDPEVTRVQSPALVDPFDKARQLYSCYYFFKPSGATDPSQKEKLGRISTQFLVRATTEIVAIDPDKNPANTELVARVGRQGLDKLKAFLSQVDAVVNTDERNRMMGAFANSCASAAGLKS